MPGLRLLVFLVVTVGILVGAFFGLSRRFTVRSNAMEPALKSGDHVAVFRFQDTFRSPTRKDVVVITHTTPAACSANVGRVIGLPGETITELDGLLSVNGKPLKEGYVEPARRDHRTRSWHVPSSTYLLLGDNRRSRCADEGLVPKRDVVGTVFMIYWPFDRFSIG